MVTNIRTGIIGVLALLVGAGGTLMLNPGELENAYICNSPTYPTVHEQVGIFDHLSSTQSTAYPNPSPDNTGSKLCKGGKWMPCNDYTQTKGLTCAEFVAQTVEQPSSATVVRRERVCFNQQQGNSECVNVVCMRED